MIYDYLEEASLLKNYENLLLGDGMLDGDNPSKRFQSFSRSFEDHEARIKFLKKYPVLARYAVKEFSLWCDASTEFLTNLSNDWSHITQKFGLDPSEKLSTIQPSGDTHNDGRSVAVSYTHLTLPTKA